MRTLLGAAAVLGVLAAGGLPAVGVTLAGADDGQQNTGARADDKPGNGPPAWAHDKPGNGPPAWAASRHHRDKQPAGKARGPEDGKERASSLGRAHGEAMRRWAACVSDPDRACGERPVPPGHLKKRR